MRLPFVRKHARLDDDFIMSLGPGPGDGLTLSQCFSNIFIAGMIGSGKTTGVGVNLATGLLRIHHDLRPAFYVKNLMKGNAGSSMRKTRRKPPMSFTSSLAGYIRLMLSRMNLMPKGVVSKVPGSSWMSCSKSRTETSLAPAADSYWPESSNRQMGYGMALIRMAGLSCGFRELLEFCQSLPSDAAQLKDPAWRRTAYAVNCLLAAAEEHEHEIAFKMAGEWLTNEWPGLNEKTKSIIQSVTINTLDRLLSSEFADLITEDTNWTPEQVMTEGRILIFDVPGAVYGPAAQLASIAIKLLFQRACRAAIYPESAGH